MNSQSQKGSSHSQSQVKTSLIVIITSLYNAHVIFVMLAYSYIHNISYQMIIIIRLSDWYDVKSYRLLLLSREKLCYLCWFYLFFHSTFSFSLYPHKRERLEREKKNSFCSSAWYALYSLLLLSSAKYKSQVNFEVRSFLYKKFSWDPKKPKDQRRPSSVRSSGYHIKLHRSWYHLPCFHSNNNSKAYYIARWCDDNDERDPIWWVV